MKALHHFVNDAMHSSSLAINMGVLQEISINGWSGVAVLGTLKELYLTFQKEISSFIYIDSIKALLISWKKFPTVRVTLAGGQK